jgi:hypothetical protein
MRKKTATAYFLGGFLLFFMASTAFVDFGNSAAAITQGMYTQAANLPANPTVPVENLTQGVVTSDGTKIFYWVQISDIHLNAQLDPEETTAFNQFCSDINSTIKPAFVVSTGDNVDSRSQSGFLSVNESDFIFSKRLNQVVNIPAFS